MNRINKDELLQLIQNRNSLMQIAKILNVEKWKVRNAIKIYGFLTPLAYARSKLSEDYLQKCMLEGRVVKDIAKELRVSRSVVDSLLVKFNIVNPRAEKLQKIKIIQQSSLDLKYKGALLGTLLGDAWLYKNNEGLVTVGFQHCERQKEYAKYKATILKELFRNEAIEIPYNEKQDKWYRTTGYRYLSISHPYISYLYDTLYGTGNKEISKESLNDLTLLGVALWFGDDGSANINDKSYYFHTNSFSLESIQNLREWMYRNLKVKTSIIKKNTSPTQHILRIVTADVEQFEKIIGPYIIELPGVNYKYKEFKIKNPQRLHVENLNNI